jgi:hypothetical protein
VFISKVVLKKFGKLTLSSLGSVCDNAVKVADKLERGGYATIEKIASDTVELEQRNNKEHKRNVTRFTIEMKKTSKFDELVKDKIK